MILEKIKQMKTLRALSMAAALLVCQPVWSYDTSSHGPSGVDMAADLVIGRPLLLATTLVGSVVWLVALPFSAAGGNVDESAQALVVGPAKATFSRCLGCPSNSYNAR